MEEYKLKIYKHPFLPAAAINMLRLQTDSDEDEIRKWVMLLE